MRRHPGIKPADEPGAVADGSGWTVGNPLPLWLGFRLPGAAALLPYFLPRPTCLEDSCLEHICIWTATGRVVGLANGGRLGEQAKCQWRSALPECPQAGSMPDHAPAPGAVLA